MSAPLLCPICNSALPLEQVEPTTGDYSIIHCTRCGKYKASRSVLKDLQPIAADPTRAALVSHVIRRMQSAGTFPFLDTDLLSAILRTKLPSLREQANHAILWLGQATSYGQSLELRAQEAQAVIGATSWEGMRLVLDQLANQGLITAQWTLDGYGSIALTYPGWEHHEEIKLGAVASRKAFMAMQYGDANLESMYDSVFTRAVEDTGFALYRVDRDRKAGLIDDQIRVEIRTSRFLIADLTHENRGAYWEAGFAEGLGKPVIYICERTKFDRDKTHFDTNHQKTLTWNREEAAEFTSLLKATIRATMPSDARLTDA